MLVYCLIMGRKIFKMNPRQWNKCWRDHGSSHSPLRQGVVLWPCSNRSFCMFASTCRCVYLPIKKILEQDTPLRMLLLHMYEKHLSYCSVLHWEAHAQCPWGIDVTRGNHQPIAAESKGEVLSGFFFPLFFFSFPQTTVKGFPNSCTLICGGLWGFKTPLLYLFFVACLEKCLGQTENFLTYLATPLEEHSCVLIFWECKMLECFLSLTAYLVF